MEYYELTDIYLSTDNSQQWWFVGTTAIFDQYDADVVALELPPAANDDRYDNVYPSMN